MTNRLHGSHHTAGTPCRGKRFVTALVLPRINLNEIVAISQHHAPAGSRKVSICVLV